jgi:hypothetical protein
VTSERERVIFLRGRTTSLTRSDPPPLSLVKMWAGGRIVDTSRDVKDECLWRINLKSTTSTPSLPIGPEISCIRMGQIKHRNITKEQGIPFPLNAFLECMFVKILDFFEF